MFERFTERARQVVVLAQEEARQEKQGYIGAEHILLGLLREDEGLAARTLQGLGVSVEQARVGVVARAKGPMAEVEGQIPFTPRARKILELSLREALSLGHNYIGTEHILLGLLREGDNTGLEILRDDFELSAEQVHHETIRMLSGPVKPKRLTQAGHPAAERASVREIEQKLAELQKSEWLLEVLSTAATLARQYPDQPTSVIARAARELHA